MTRIFPVLAAVLLALSANTAAAGVFNPDTFTLENGMRVVVIENPRVPVVTHMVWYSVGSADEGPGESGIAHVLEHLMFKGTKKRQPGEFSKILARNGGQENAFTSSDYTAYFQTVAADRLEMVMEMEADRMTNLVLTADSVETEKKVIMEERRSRTDNNPSGILAEQANAALYLNYPYRRPVIGWAHEIKALSRESILAFYKKWYAPENAILVVAGDITAEKLKPLAEQYYGVIPRGPGVKRLRPKEPPQKAMRRVTLKDKRVRQAAWSRTYLAPSYLYGASEHAYALQVLSGIFGGGSSSRLYRALVVDNKIAVTAGTHYGAGNRGPSSFSVQASPRPGVTMTELEKRIEGELVKLLKDGVTESEVKRVIKRMQARSIYARDSQSGGARALGAALATGLDVDDVESWPDRIGAVTVDAVNKAARYVLREGRSVTSLLLPKETG